MVKSPGFAKPGILKILKGGEREKVIGLYVFWKSFVREVGHLQVFEKF
jgi:hypothetical protein